MELSRRLRLIVYRCLENSIFAVTGHQYRRWTFYDCTVDSVFFACHPPRSPDFGKSETSQGRLQHESTHQSTHESTQHQSATGGRINPGSQLCLVISGLRATNHSYLLFCSLSSPSQFILRLVPHLRATFFSQELSSWHHDIISAILTRIPVFGNSTDPP